jgi:hypothetical protein
MLLAHSEPYLLVIGMAAGICIGIVLSAAWILKKNR